MNTPCKIDQFSLFQKISMRILLYVFFITGILGVWLENQLWGLTYLIAMAFVGFTIIQCFCSHCPYPYKKKTCLGMPYQAVTLFPHKDRPLTLLEKLLFIGALSFAMLFPQYFLWQNKPLFALYWVFCLPTCIIFPVYYCRRCAFTNCPFNPQVQSSPKETYTESS